MRVIKQLPSFARENIKTNKQTDRQTESENVRCHPRWRPAFLYDVIIMHELTINEQVASFFKKTSFPVFVLKCPFLLIFTLLLF